MYPYLEFQPFSLQNLDRSECVAEFRVKKEDIPIVADLRLYNFLNVLHALKEQFVVVWRAFVY